MGEWTEVELSAIADVQTGPFGSQLHASDYVPVGVPVIMPNNIGQRLTLDESNMSYITEADATRLARYKVQEGDIVFSRRGDVDKCILIDARKSGWFCGTGCLFARGNSTKADRTFVAYQFDGPVLKHWLRAHAVGTTMPNLNSAILGGAPVALPELSEQRAIASVLSSLDAKVDLLHRQNKTLEAMAETLFRQWFVEEAEEGWEEMRLDQFSTVGIGRTPPRKEQHWFSTDSADVKWISIKDMAADGPFIFSTAEYLTDEAVERFRVPVIPKDTVVLSFKMTLGRLKITTEEMLSNEAIAHFRINPDSHVTKEFLYLGLKTYQYETLGSTSTIVDSINSGMIKEMVLQIPPKPLMDRFMEQCGPWFEKIKSNQLQIQTLTALRNTLLPKLMSGEVRVEERTEQVHQS